MIPDTFRKGKARNKKEIKQERENYHIIYDTDDPRTEIHFQFDEETLKRELSIDNSEIVKQIDKLSQKKLDELIEKGVHKIKTTITST